MTKEPLVEKEIRGCVAIITLNRPKKRDALSVGLHHPLNEAFRAFPDSVRAVVLAGEGRHFCAGLDLAEHREDKPFEGSLHSRAAHQVVESIRYCGWPVISALHRAVVGGGFEIASPNTDPGG